MLIILNVDAWIKEPINASVVFVSVQIPIKQLLL